ncbi:MAG: hypothetical protein H0W85_00675 [Methylotenera sp.]|nr:hypothetical protein [Methylotenera sp.]
MSATEKLSVAALIGVILRRRINRTIDVKWLVENDAYAREIIKISREQKLEDLNEYADHLEKLTFGESKPNMAPAPAQSMEDTAKADIHEWLKETEPEVEEKEDDAVLDASKYIGGLR